MGRKSTKENKTIYQLSREAAGLTRERASELLQVISADRIEKIESEKLSPHPEDILAMADCYKSPTLCNQFCSNICPIGRHYIPEVKIKDPSQITLELLATLNSLENDKNRLIEIMLDGIITSEEYPDFVLIRQKLDNLSLAIDSLKLWVDNAISSGNIQVQ